jgi:hypothetical protein
VLERDWHNFFVRSYCSLFSVQCSVATCRSEPVNELATEAEI